MLIELQNTEESMDIDKILKLKPTDISVQSHFLNERSEVSISFRSFNEAKLYIFEGTSNYKSWVEEITPGKFHIHFQYLLFYI